MTEPLVPDPDINRFPMSTDALSEARLRALMDARRGVLAELDLESILERVLDAARELTGARYAAIGVLDGDRRQLERFLTTGIDEDARRRIGDLPTGRGVLGTLIRDPNALRLDEVSDHPDSAGFPSGHPPMHTFLGVPIMIRGVSWGNLYLAEKASGEPFTEADEESAIMLADSAAIAVGHAGSIDRARLQQSIESAERERSRWARELHDETLQGLGALRLSLSSALRTGSGYEEAVAGAVAQLTEEIAKLRGLIVDLRPASLDEIGLQSALETLIERTAARSGIEIEAVIALAFEAGAEDERLDRRVDEAVYRVVQEALTNAVKHAHADHAVVRVVERAREITLTVSDDGRGFEPKTVRAGFGLSGIRERAEILGGAIDIDSTPGAGTTVTGTFPALRAAPDYGVGRGTSSPRGATSTGQAAAPTTSAETLPSSTERSGP